MLAKNTSMMSSYGKETPQERAEIGIAVGVHVRASAMQEPERVPENAPNILRDIPRELK